MKLSPQHRLLPSLPPGTRTPAGVRLYHARPMIALDDGGAVRQVAWNPRSAKIPARAPTRAPLRACRRSPILNDEARAAGLRLEAGDALVMDNTRTLHGRTAYQPSGVRTCRDATWTPRLRSKLAVIGI